MLPKEEQQRIKNAWLIPKIYLKYRFLYDVIIFQT